MRITRSAVAILSLTLLLVASFASAGAALAGGRPFSTQLTGAAEVPVPTSGDPDGSGQARITLNPGTGEVCYQVSVTGVDLPLLAGHIHEAPAGMAGLPVITFDPMKLNGGWSCVSAARSLILEIIRNPSDYYVNVHNSAYPAGALRGQLSR